MLILRRHGTFVALTCALIAALAWLFFFGGGTRISLWAASEQREVQRALAGALRAIKTGEPWAWISLMGLCFAYGFFHAAGPGHGKIVMGGYALGENVPRARLIGLTLAGSLGQAVTAIVVVYAGVLVFGWTRTQMTSLADDTLALFSAVAIAAVGVWLVLRGMRKLRPIAIQTDHHHDHHHHGDDGVCASCGHAHAPSPSQIAKVRSWRDAVAIVGAVAIRPCTGALFVLILTYGMGIGAAGIAGAIVMALGTALLTLGVALGAHFVRDGLAARINGAAGLRTMASIEIVAGIFVTLAAISVALRLL